MKLVDVTADTAFQHRVAEILIDGFDATGVQPWLSVDDAIDEVAESVGDERVSRAAIDEHGDVIGWIAGFNSYAYVWELHPLVVRADSQGRGIGRALVEDFERIVGERGGLTITLGTDDENERTTIGGIDLYPGLLGKLSAIRDRGRHPFGFYLKMGYEISGVVPDANGFGKPDILMCKRVSRP